MQTYNLEQQLNIIEIIKDNIRIFEKLSKLNNTITLCNNETEYFETIKTLKEVIREENDWSLYYYNEDEEKKINIKTNYTTYNYK